MRTGEFKVTGARPMEFEDLERALRRSLRIADWVSWTVIAPRRPVAAAQAAEQLVAALDDFYAAREAAALGRVEWDGEDDIFDSWLRLLQAREDLARGERKAFAYQSRQIRRGKVVLTVDTIPNETMIGTEWDIRGLGDARGRGLVGEIIDQNSNTVTILPHYSRDRAVPDRGTLHPYLGPTQRALQRQTDAVTAAKSRTSVRPDLRDLIVHPDTCKAPRSGFDVAWRSTKLNDDKRAAVLAGIGLDDLMVVQGPPGTGKTSFITELSHQYLQSYPDSRILIVSQTHVAVDNALERLDAAAIDGVVRLGSADNSRISSTVHHLLLDQQMLKWTNALRRRAETHLERQAADSGVSPEHLRACLALERLASVLEQITMIQAAVDEQPPSSGTATLAASLGDDADSPELQARLDRLSEDKQQLLADAQTELSGDLTLSAEPSIAEAKAAVDLILGSDSSSRQLLRLLELQGEWLQRVSSDENLVGVFLQTTRVVAGTCLGLLRHRAVRSLNIDLCVIDEASKATATEAMVPLALSKRAILVGDSNQLPPLDEDLLRRTDILQEHDLNRPQVEETLFARLAEQLPLEAKFTLSEQYRMIRPIGDMISTCFYDGKLRSPNTVGLGGYELLAKPVQWIDTSLMGDKRREDLDPGAGSSVVNRTEAGIVLDRLEVLEKAISKGVLQLPDGQARLEVPLIAPYRRQVEELRRRIASFRSNSMVLTVESVDAVQGREADLAFFSVTRSNSAGRLGFIGGDYWRRINVALSRARFGLTIVGDAEFCRGNSGALHDVLGYIHDHPDECDLRSGA